MLRLEQTTAPQLCALLEHDRVPFAVMRNILAGAFGPVGKILSDEKRMIVCYTCPPFPGWAWLPKDATEAEMASCWQVIREELPPESGYCINMTPALAAYVMGTQEGKALRSHRRINAYACDVLVELPPVAGDLVAVGMEHLDLLAHWAEALSVEENLDLRPFEAHLEATRGFIERKRLFIWRTPEGEPAAMCAVTEEEGLGYISLVYTPVEKRRRGYAAALVREVCRCLLVQGMRPALCTDATYAPSNACYRKLGFQLEGEIVTIGL